MKRLLIVTVLVILFLPVAVVAQEEITLENLAEIVAILSAKTEEMDKRLGDIESFFADDGPVEMYGNGCLIALESYSAELLDLEGLRDEAVLSYKQAFDEWLVVSTVEIHSVLFNTETAHMGITYRAPNDRFMVEEWDGCELVQASEWWEE